MVIVCFPGEYQAASRYSWCQTGIIYPDAGGDTVFALVIIFPVSARRPASDPGAKKELSVRCRWRLSISLIDIVFPGSDRQLAGERGTNLKLSGRCR